MEEDIRDLKMQVDSVLSVVMLIPVESVERLLEALHRQEAIQPMLDPTAFMQVARHIPKHMEVYRKLLALQRAVAEAVDLFKGEVA